jgi:hypothetical protein
VDRVQPVVERASTVVDRVQPVIDRGGGIADRAGLVGGQGGGGVDRAHPAVDQSGGDAAAGLAGAVVLAAPVDPGPGPARDRPTAAPDAPPAWSEPDDHTAALPAPAGKRGDSIGGDRAAAVGAGPAGPAGPRAGAPPTGRARVSGAAPGERRREPEASDGRAPPRPGAPPLPPGVMASAASTGSAGGLGLAMLAGLVAACILQLPRFRFPFTWWRPVAVAHRLERPG